MSTINDGGPAFPQVETTVSMAGDSNDYTPISDVHTIGGMTLRDYFAAKANNTDIEASRMAGEDTNDPVTRCLARFRHADAMLAAREAQS